MCLRRNVLSTAPGLFNRPQKIFGSKPCPMDIYYRSYGCKPVPPGLTAQANQDVKRLLLCGRSQSNLMVLYQPLFRFPAARTIIIKVPVYVIRHPVSHHMIGCPGQFIAQCLDCYYTILLCLFTLVESLKFG